MVNTISKLEQHFEFVQLLTAAGHISREQVCEAMNMQKSAFYFYLKNAKKMFKIEYVGNLGGSPYYSIDKKTVQKYFNL